MHTTYMIFADLFAPDIDAELGSDEAIAFLAGSQLPRDRTKVQQENMQVPDGVDVVCVSPRVMRNLYTSQAFDYFQRTVSDMESKGPPMRSQDANGLSQMRGPYDYHMETKMAPMVSSWQVMCRLAQCCEHFRGLLWDAKHVPLRKSEADAAERVAPNWDEDVPLEDEMGK